MQHVIAGMLIITFSLIILSAVGFFVFWYFIKARFKKVYLFLCEMKKEQQVYLEAIAQSHKEISDVKQRINRLKGKQHKFEAVVLSSGTYDQAVRLAKIGTDKSEMTLHSGLSEAEVNLIFNLHQPQPTRR